MVRPCSRAFPRTRALLVVDRAATWLRQPRGHPSMPTLCRPLRVQRQREGDCSQSSQWQTTWCQHIHTCSHSWVTHEAARSRAYSWTRDQRGAGGHSVVTGSLEQARDCGESTTLEVSRLYLAFPSPPCRPTIVHSHCREYTAVTLVSASTTSQSISSDWTDTLHWQF